MLNSTCRTEFCLVLYRASAIVLCQQDTFKFNMTSIIIYTSSCTSLIGGGPFLQQVVSKPVIRSHDRFWNISSLISHRSGVHALSNFGLIVWALRRGTRLDYILPCISCPLYVCYLVFGTGLSIVASEYRWLRAAATN